MMSDDEAMSDEPMRVVAKSGSGMLMCSCGSIAKDDDDDIKLNKCTPCEIDRYCIEKCLKEHRPQYEEVSEQRMAEIRDEILFKQPESTHLGDCPICCLPLEQDFVTSQISHCCSKMICGGCNFANQKREFEGRLENTCPFCRLRLPKSKKETERHKKKRIEANDPLALREEGAKRLKNGDYKDALKYLLKAVEYGDAASHYYLSLMYCNGQGVKKDKKEEVYHMEQAAIGGHTNGRYNLGNYEWIIGRWKRAVKHWIITAKLGHDISLRRVRENYSAGLVSKEDFAAALRAHQAAMDAAKSPHREVAEAYFRKAARSGW